MPRRDSGRPAHAFYGDAEMVLGLGPVRVIQSEVPAWVEEWVVEWGSRHAEELMAMPRRLRQALPC